MAQIHRLVERIAVGAIHVMLLGETGVGKEVFAQRIHALSRRAAGPFLSLNCAAFTASLLESELFGHEKGAFSGAVRAKIGLLESASGGTVFLDEIGELPAALQATLLRVLEEQRVRPVGALRSRPIDVRFVSATNRDLDAEVAAGRFRSDLVFRLNGFSVVIPPLRARPAELEPLALRFVAVASQQTGRRAPTLHPDTLMLLRGYHWPGNVRELKNVMERAVLLCDGPELLPEHLPADRMAAAPAADDDPERTRITRALAATFGNQTRAAELLGISRRTLVTKIEKLALPRPRKR
jgi:transcriptional regulator with PAS, ATPase and Fis domain